MSSPDRTIALVPAYEEAARVAAVVAGALKHLPVLVVDDGSRDDTSGVARAAGATVLRQEPNQGKGVALRAGFRRALDDGYDAVVTLDADGQHDAAEIPRFLEARRASRAALVIGAREFSRMPPVRRVANALARRVFSWALGQHVADNQSGYRLLHRSLLTELLESREAGYEFEVEMIVTCVEKGLGLEWVPIRTIYGDEKSHIDPVTHAREFTRIVLQTRRRMRR